jgi:hypothetical protein
MHKRTGAAFGAFLLVAGCSPIEELVTPGSQASPVILSRSHEPNAMMDALFTGRVIADARGCLRLDGPDQHTVIWPQGFTIARRGATWAVLDATGGNAGTVGGSFRLGGGELTEVPSDMLSAADQQRASTCPGRYWLAWIPES